MRSKLARHLFLAGVLLYGLAYWFIHPLAFFTSDIGLRHLQMTQLIAHRWQSFAIDYPLAFVDPGLMLALDHVPYYQAYGFVEGEIYFLITPFFPLLGSWLLTLLGPLSLPLLSVGGGLLCAAVIYDLARRSALPQASLAFWLTLFGTPLLFYSVTLWDHAFASGVALLALWLVARGVDPPQPRYLLGGGIVAAWATGQRPELHLFAIALGVALLWASWPRWQALLWYGAGGLMGLLPLWLFQWRWFGHPLGMATAPNLLGYSRPASYPVPTPPILQDELLPLIYKGRLLVFVEAGDPLSLLAALLTLIGSVLLVLALRNQRRPLFTLALLLGVGGYLAYIYLATQTLLTGVLSTLPLMALSLCYPREKGAATPLYRLLYGSALLYLGGMLLLWPGYGGLQWGSRYLLALYPPLIYLALYLYTHYRATLGPAWQPLLRRGWVLLLLLGLLLQGVGLYHLYRVQQERLVVKRAVGALPTPFVITNAPYAPAELSALEEKQFLYVQDEAMLSTLLSHLGERGVARVAIFGLEALPLDIPARVPGFRVEEREPFVYYLIREQQP